MLRWWRTHRRDSRVSLVRSTPRVTPGQRDAARALRRAERARDEARRRRTEVAECASELRQARTTNHFAERFRASMEGGA